MNKRILNIDLILCLDLRSFDQNINTCVEMTQVYYCCNPEEEEEKNSNANANANASAMGDLNHLLYNQSLDILRSFLITNYMKSSNAQGCNEE